MKMLAIARKNMLEMLRDPLTALFGLGFPLVLLLLLSAIQANVPVPLFEIANLTPGIAVFGLSFLALFSALSLSRDRCSALLQRLYTTPLKPRHFIAGYALPMIPLALAQSILCYGAAALLGLSWNGYTLLSILSSLLPALLFIGIGLLCGSMLSDKQAGGICGALLTNLCAWLSGAWFDLSLVGGAFEKAAHILPFYHAVQMEKMLLQGNISALLPHLMITAAYALFFLIGAVILFLRQMRRQ